ncbi:DUF2911 domain-containing protein [Flavobacteriaceae bacterium F89]|uniref:DUF2911 domain-containing protein n=1 Tax=Cerina litoralis TaxID=2874477 RepID=A0AAE3EVX7_9FLAO|nr:DUF2911 domain-containing protein [Cerina litoralis]MCG2462027.1 DUF2911 domain-containing protein [Cerina litoralis]
MKKSILFLSTILCAFSMQGQIVTPAPSPGAHLEQKVGLTDVAIDYSRPSMKGRTIFGNLVPYEKVWRTGANANTTISFSTDVSVDGQTLKKGTYALYTKPGEESWEVYFYSDTDNGGLPQSWDDSKVVAKVSAKVYPMPINVETFTISLDNLTNDSAVLGILWEKTYVGVKFDVPTDATVMNNINRVMGGPTAADYYAAAVYYMDSGKDIEQAKKWIDRSAAMTEKPAFWQLRQQSLIYAKAGDRKGAIETAKKSLAAAKVAGNADYVKMNEDSLREWGAN